MKLWLILNYDGSLKLIYGELTGNTFVQGKNKTKKKGTFKLYWNRKTVQQKEQVQHP